MKLIDSHCHLHDSEFFDAEVQAEAYAQSIAAGVTMICVGTDVRSSHEAVEFAESHDNVWAVIGIHPHEAAASRADEIRALLAHKSDTVVGIGEIGLDYYYDHSPRQVQLERLGEQLRLAVEFDLPVSFHVRDEKAGGGAVWCDFWQVFDKFANVRGVLHSFTDTPANLQAGLARGLYVGVNGISTFTRDSAQQKMYRELPLERMLLETDAPYLTPAPFRGKMNIPAYVGKVAEFQARERGISPDEIMRITTANTQTLFGVKLCEKTYERPQKNFRH